MIHITPVYVQCKENHIVGDCSTNGDSTSGGNINGSVIDLQAFRTRFTHFQPIIAGTMPGVTSTAGAGRVSLSLIAQHGNSSGGGDMAGLSTDQMPTLSQNYRSTAMSTDHQSWSTGTLRMQFSPAAVSLLGAKRYVRVQGVVQRVGVATSTAAGNLVTVHLGANLLKPQEEGPMQDLAVMPGGDFQALTAVLATASNT
jgi:hypothetical protein